MRLTPELIFLNCSIIIFIIIRMSVSLDVIDQHDESKLLFLFHNAEIFPSFLDLLNRLFFFAMCTSNLTNFFVCGLTGRERKKKFYRWWSDKLNDNFFSYQQLLRNQAFSIGFNFCSLLLIENDKKKKSFSSSFAKLWDEVGKRGLVERIKKRIVISVTSF